MSFPSLPRALTRSRSARAKRTREANRDTLRSRQLCHEPLEDRRLLSAGYFEWIDQFGGLGPSDDWATSVAGDGSIYVAGGTGGTLPGQTSAGLTDAFVRKYDANGDEVWSRQFGTSSTDFATGISIGTSGVYVTGAFQGGDTFVRKYDTDGNEIWARQFGSSSGRAISVDISGVYVVGDTSSALPGDLDVFVRMYDANGTEVWTRQFGTSKQDYLKAVSVDASGVYVAGHTYGSLSGYANAGYQDAFIRKYDADGSEVWTHQFGTSTSDSAVAISVSGSGVFVAGFTNGTLPGQTRVGDMDTFVRKYDVDGNEVWTDQFGSDVGQVGYRDVYPRGISADTSGVYVTGITSRPLPGQTLLGRDDAFVRKYDVDGNEDWTRQFGTSLGDGARSVFADASGVYVTGDTEGALPGQTSVGDDDVFVRKYNVAGIELWTRQFGGLGPVSEYARAVATDGDVYVAGDTYGALPGQTSAGGDDAFVRKYDALGNLVWTRQFGSSADDYAYGISLDASGVYVTGWTEGILPGQTGMVAYIDAFVRKYDADGNELWTRQFGATGGSHSYPRNYAYGISADASGVYVAGSAHSEATFPGQPAAGLDDAFVRKYDADGNEIWTRQFGSAEHDNAYGIFADVSGIYVTGSAGDALPGQTGAGSDDAFVRKYDAAGNVLWTRQFGTGYDEEGRGIHVHNSGVYLTGTTQGALPGQSRVGDLDAYVRRYDTEGNEIWTRQFGSTRQDEVWARGISVDSSGVYIAGYNLGTFPGQTGVGSYDAFVLKYDTTGNPDWTRQFGTEHYDHVYGISAHASGVYVAGYTHNTLPGQVSAGGNDAFVANLVKNVSPIANGGGAYEGLEGSTISFDASGSSDPDGNELQYRWDFDNDGAWDTAYSIDPTATHSWDDNYSVTVVVEVYDGYDASENTATVAVGNLPPTLTVAGNQIADEGAQLSITDLGTFTDPGLDYHTFTIDWGDGSAPSTGHPNPFNATSGSFDGAHTYAENGIYTVTITLVDDEGDSDTKTFDVTVENVAPTLTLVENQTVELGSQLSLANLGTVADPALDHRSPGDPPIETFTYSIDWGDETAIDTGDVWVPETYYVVLNEDLLEGYTYKDIIEPDVTIWRYINNIPVNDTATLYGVNCDFAFGPPEEAMFPGVDRITGAATGGSTVPLGPYPYNPGKEITVNNDLLTIRSLISGNLYQMDLLSWADDDYQHTCWDADGGVSSATAGFKTSYVRKEPGEPDEPIFDGSHTYAELGTYTVTVTVTDDDGGSDMQTFEVVVYVDDDLDGVSNSQEDAAPNNGDGNDDGTLDSQQVNVTSLPNSVDQAYVTLVSPTETLLSDVVATDNPSPGDAPVGIEFPIGFLDFEVQDVSAGGSATVTLIAPAGTVFDTYYKYGPTPSNATPHWYEFLFDGTTGAEIAGNMLTLHFVDGERGDDDLTANGVVVDPGAPGLAVPVFEQPDPNDPGKTALVVHGTEGSDHIVFQPGNVTGDVVVQLNGVSYGPYHPTGRLIAYGGDGDDTMQVTGSLDLPVWLYGQGGNDKLRGGGGNDMIDGGPGDDLLVGKSGHDLLIGGLGTDRIVGNADDDILIAAYTNFHRAAVDQIMQRWTSDGEAIVRRDAVIEYMADNTLEVYDDDERDMLTGSSGIDWFFANLDGDGVLDKVTDLDDELFASDLDFILAG